MKIKISLTVAIIMATYSAINLFAEEQPQQKKSAPQFSYQLIDSKEKVSPETYKGEVLLIDFWASWCPPCHKAYPYLESAYKKYHDKGFNILGVSIDDDEKAWKKAVADKKMPWPNVMTDDTGRSVSKLYSFNAIPHFVLIDKKGNILESGFAADQIDELVSKYTK